MSYSTYEKVLMDDKLPVRIITINADVIASLMRSVSLDLEHFIPPHWHRSVEMSYVVSGGVKLRVNDQSRTVYGGDFLLVNSGNMHEFNSLANLETEIIVLLISYDFLKEIIPTIDSISFNIQKTKVHYPRLSELFLEISTLFGNGSDYDHLLITSRLYEVMSILVNYYAEEKEAMNPEFALAKEVLSTIHDHYQDNLSVNDIAETYHLSREHFSRLFKKTFGISFMQYLINYRLYRAFPDIVSTQKSIQDISIDHGFPNTKSLINHFKKRYQQTPGEFRKNHKGTIIDHNNDINRQNFML